MGRFGGKRLRGFGTIRRNTRWHRSTCDDRQAASRSVQWQIHSHCWSVPPPKPPRFRGSFSSSGQESYLRTLASSGRVVANSSLFQIFASQGVHRSPIGPLTVFWREFCSQLQRVATDTDGAALHVPFGIRRDRCFLDCCLSPLQPFYELFSGNHLSNVEFQTTPDSLRFLCQLSVGGHKNVAVGECRNRMEPIKLAI